MDHTAKQIVAFKAAVLADLAGPGADALHALRAGIEPSLSSAQLVELALTEVGGSEMPELLTWPGEVREIEVIEGAPLYCIGRRGIYLWRRPALHMRGAGRHGYLSIWVTHPAYPPGW